MATESLSLRIDSSIKEQAKNLFAEYGLDLSTAINLFLRQAIRERGFTFDLHPVPNADTIAAIREAEAAAHNPNAKGYSDFDELFKDLKA